MKKVTDLTLTELNHWVAKASGFTDTLGGVLGNERAWLLPDGKSRILKAMYRPSHDWCQGGNVIERCEMDIKKSNNRDLWYACMKSEDTGLFFFGHGETPLLAAMRCYVTSVYGDAVDD